jgi:hypothetical protein
MCPRCPDVWFGSGSTVTASVFAMTPKYCEDSCLKMRPGARPCGSTLIDSPTSVSKIAQSVAGVCGNGTHFVPERGVSLCRGTQVTLCPECETTRPFRTHQMPAAQTTPFRGATADVSGCFSFCAGNHHGIFHSAEQTYGSTRYQSNSSEHQDKHVFMPFTCRYNFSRRWILYCRVPGPP